MEAFAILAVWTHAVTGVSWSLDPNQIDPLIDDSNVENPRQSYLMRVWGDVRFHVAVGVDATTTDMPVEAGGQGVLIVVPPNSTISVIKRTGETDGNVWFTRVKRA